MTRHNNETGQFQSPVNASATGELLRSGITFDVAPSASGGKATVEIIIPVYNQVEYTRKCLESLRQTTRTAASVIVIDNGSTDGTPEYLANLPALTVIRNEKNRGCAAAWNQGIAASTGEWVVVLNNDVVLTPGWLDGLLAAAVEIGLDIVSPALREGPLNYELEAYAREFVRSTGGATRPGVAHGVCFLVRRRVFESVGLFDENFRIGQFEDADFFHRARQAGFALGATGQSFVHHFGSVTQNYVRQQLPLEAYEDWNRAYYRSKWTLGWHQRCLTRWKARAQVAWWRAWELHLCGHSLAERWQHGQLEYE